MPEVCSNASLWPVPLGENPQILSLRFWCLKTQFKYQNQKLNTCPYAPEVGFMISDEIRTLKVVFLGTSIHLFFRPWRQQRPSLSKGCPALRLWRPVAIPWSLVKLSARGFSLLFAYRALAWREVQVQQVNSGGQNITALEKCQVSRKKRFGCGQTWVLFWNFLQ